ncbi:unnamed protein product, partial [Allacma fusca]
KVRCNTDRYCCFIKKSSILRKLTWNFGFKKNLTDIIHEMIGFPSEIMERIYGKLNVLMGGYTSIDRSPSDTSETHTEIGPDGNVPFGGCPQDFAQFLEAMYLEGVSKWEGMIWTRIIEWIFERTAGIHGCSPTTAGFGFVALGSPVSLFLHLLSSGLGLKY